MFVVTNENFHIYVVTFIGLLVICFAVELYIKNCLDTEIINLKRKVRKIQVMQEIMYKQRQQELKKQQEEQEQEQEQEQEENNDYMMNDGDSYMDPITGN